MTRPVFTTAVSTPVLRTFHDALKEEMERFNITPMSLSRHCSVSREEIEKWRTGQDVPTSLQMKKLVGRIRSMSPYISLIRKGREDVQRPKLLLPPPKAFGPSLREMRMDEGMEHQELAGLLHITKEEIVKIEAGLECPTSNQYDLLVGLFPRLGDVETPTLKDDLTHMPQPAPVLVRSAPASADLNPKANKKQLIRWVAMTTAILQSNDGPQFVEFLKAAKDSGFDLDEVIEVLTAFRS